MGAVAAEPLKLTSFKILLRSNSLGATNSGDASNKRIDFKIYKNGVDAGLSASVLSGQAVGLHQFNNSNGGAAELSLSEGDRVTFVVINNSPTGSGVVTYNFVAGISVMGSKGDRGLKGDKGDQGAQGATGSVNKEEMIKYSLIFG